MCHRSGNDDIAGVADVAGVDDEEAADQVFMALANRTRRAILDRLRDQPRTTGQLCAAFPRLDRCTTMQHIGVLERAGLVVAQRTGRERWNHLDVGPIVRIHDRWIGEYAWSSARLIANLQAALPETEETR